MGAIATIKSNLLIHRRDMVKVAVLFLLVLVMSSCNLFNKDTKPQLDLPKLKSSEAIITFCFSTIPKVYSGLVKLNDEITLIDKELERLKEIEAEFSQQGRIIAVERNNWKKVKQALQVSLADLEREVEKIYVTHLVNKKKGMDLIKKSMNFLATTIKTATEDARPHTKRLEVVVQKSFVENLKDKLFG